MTRFGDTFNQVTTRGATVKAIRAAARLRESRQDDDLWRQACEAAVGHELHPDTDMNEIIPADESQWTDEMWAYARRLHERLLAGESLAYHPQPLTPKLRSMIGDDPGLRRMASSLGFAESRLDERPKDEDARAHATQAFKDLRAYLASGKARWTAETKTLLVNMLGVNGDRLKVWFDVVPPDSKEPGASYSRGRNGDWASIVLNYPCANYDEWQEHLQDADGIEPRILAFMFDALRSAFIHEYSHHVSLQRHPDIPGGSHKQFAAGERDAYYNNPEELNAFYQEAAEHYEELLRVGAEQGKLGAMWRVMIGNSPRQFIQTFTAYLENNFSAWSTLDADNQRRVIKRATGLYDELRGQYQSLAKTESIAEGAQDAEFRKIATDAHNRIGKMLKNLKNNDAHDLLTFKTSMRVPDHNNVAVTFDPKIANAYLQPLKDGSYLLALGVKTSKEYQVANYVRLLQSIWPVLRGMFIHEFTHYLDLERGVGKTVDSYQNTGGIGDDAAYTNHPLETNAYFQQMAVAIEDMVDAEIKKRRTRLAWKNFEEFRQFVQAQMDQNTHICYDLLTPENTKKLWKRIAQLWTDVQDRLAAHKAAHPRKPWTRRKVAEAVQPDWAEGTHADPASPAYDHRAEWIKVSARNAGIPARHVLSVVRYTGSCALRDSLPAQAVRIFAQEALGREMWPYREGWQITEEEAEWLGFVRKPNRDFQDATVRELVARRAHVYESTGTDLNFWISPAGKLYRFNFDIDHAKWALRNSSKTGITHISGNEPERVMMADGWIRGYKVGQHVDFESMRCNAEAVAHVQDALMAMVGDGAGYDTEWEVMNDQRRAVKYAKCAVPRLLSVSTFDEIDDPALAERRTGT